MTANTQLKLDTTYIHDPRLGPHGLTQAQLDEISSRLRDILVEISNERNAGQHRFRELPHERIQIDEIKQAVADYRDNTDTMIVLGIGGSALGNSALQSALNPFTYNLLPAERRKGPRLFVLDNVDPVSFEAVMDICGQDWSRTLVNVISKSGETAETSAQFLIVRDRMIKALGEDEARQRIIVTTDASHGTMRKIVDQQRYRSLMVPDGVGGRFSVLTPVGLLSAAMCGIDIDQLLDGAGDMDAAVSDLDPATNPAARIAAIHHLYMERGKKMHVMMPYSQQLRDMADWYRQLWAESLGKIRPSNGENVGPTPIKALGATDQHSQVQLYREGPNDKVITFLEVEEFDVDTVIPRGFVGVEAMDYLGRSKEGTLGGLLNTEKKATELALLAIKLRIRQDNR
jgi:glucose-6-phosphate isomerase